MATKKKYSHILAEILERNHSKCICPTSFLESLKVPELPNDIDDGGCQFGPNCQFSINCQYNKANCTCYPQCTCDLAVESPRPLAGPSGKCSHPSCTCVGSCFCQSEESFLLRSANLPPSHCDKEKCICSICLCRPQELPKSYLPSCFRNNVKAASYKLMSDDEIKQECAEIKQLLNEHEENQKKEVSSPQTSVVKDQKKIQLKKTVSIVKDFPPKKKSLTAILETEKKSVSDVILEKEKDAPLSVKTVSRGSKSILRTLNTNETQSKVVQKEDKSQKKEKRKSVKLSSSGKKDRPKTISRSHHTRRSSVLRKPMRIRYYYSGETEHYGVKLGHENCVTQQTLVPKHMGWLWNIEDHSKGIRERKGWPPGFIGKSIKNMIKVMKKFEENEASGEKQEKENLRRWTSAKNQEVEDTEPKEEPPLLHIHKKGRTYNITFCPKNSDDDIGPIPIPFTITDKRRDSDSESSESTLEFELHSPKPRLKPKTSQFVQKVETQNPPAIQDLGETSPVEEPPPDVPKTTNKKKPKKKSIGSEENKILWEDQLTQIEKIA